VERDFMEWEGFKSERKKWLDAQITAVINSLKGI
jgi:hypothetical protein